jgi:hypothetical protein
MANPPFAQFSLRFRKGLTEGDLTAIFAAVPGWEPQLTPAVTLRGGPGWSPAATRFVRQDLDDLIAACVAQRPLDWIFGTQSSRADWQVKTTFEQLFLDLRFYWSGALAPRMIGLLSALAPGLAPGMGFAVDRLRDEPLTRDGLQEITGMPPLLFLDHAATAHVGDTRVRSAPCLVQAALGGLLLVVADDLDTSVTPAGYARRAQVFSHLGLFPGAPLR